MTAYKSFYFSAIAAAFMACSGCATAPWHEPSSLMNNQQLIAASCADLAAEDQRLADNAEHLRQTSRFSTGGAAVLAVLTGLASGASGQMQSTTSVENMASTADLTSEQARKNEERRQAVSMVKAKRGC
jgi:hypothetical protein